MASTTTDFLHQAISAPSLGIPAGASVKVQIIDSTSRIHAPVAAFMKPAIQGHQQIRVPAFSFLIEQPSSSRRILFDLGLRKDWQNLPPAIITRLSRPDWALDVQQNVSEILQKNGVNVAGGEIEAVIWSHWHFDHTGDMTTFPSSTILITGSGVQDALLPGYPTSQESNLLESDFSGREHREIDFAKAPTTEIGKFKAYDYFKDGSFYLLNAPGHAIGHICGLARVTSVQEGDAEDTFVFMGADTAHHGGAIRPNEYLPLPKDINPSPLPERYASSCPGHVLEAVHPNKKANEPYYQINDGMPHNRDDAIQSLQGMQGFDAVDNVFVIIAHDDTLLNPQLELGYFPNGDLKDWKAKDYANKVRWAFLKDFEKAIE